MKDFFSTLPRTVQYKSVEIQTDMRKIVGRHPHVRKSIARNPFSRRGLALILRPHRELLWSETTRAAALYTRSKHV